MSRTKKIDPSRTAIIRRKFVAEMNRRFGKLSRDVWDLVVTDDVFGLKLRKPLKILQTAIPKKAWQFRTSAQKTAAFRTWLQQQVNAGILAVDNVGKPWTSKYVESAYKKGLERAYFDTRRTVFATEPSPQYYLGGKEEFLRTAFFAPESMDKVELLATRSFEELKGVTATMGQQMNRILAGGLAEGKTPAKMAREMQASIKKLTPTKARAIARTEVIYAHAEGQLDAFKILGIKEVKAEVEWLTAGDPLVCDECSAMEGNRYNVDQAHGMIPLHPNCRCAWIPVT